ncbi:MAG: hypothetical protein EXR95_03715 [Gemmatimonadetes bacterium]|nr:hypothetical protein [Gemmatimonadota bacterium]
MRMGGARAALLVALAAEWMVGCQELFTAAPAGEDVLDGPLPGLTNDEMIAFARGFSEVDGLGPIFNNVSCASCHSGDGRGRPENALVRFGVAPDYSAHHGAYNTFEADGIRLDERRDLTIGVVDFEVALSGVRLQGEGAKAWIDLPPSLEGLFAGRQTGYYVEAAGDFGSGLVKTMPASFFTWKARLDAIDLDSGLPGDSREQLSMGLSFRPTRDTALKLDFVRGRSHDRFNNRAQHAAMLFSIATYF